MKSWTMVEGGFEDRHPNALKGVAIKFSVVSEGIQISMEADFTVFKMWFTIDEAQMVSDYLQGLIIAQRLAP